MSHLNLVHSVRNIHVPSDWVSGKKFCPDRGFITQEEMLIEQAIDYSESCLWTSPKALLFLQNHLGFTNLELAKTLNVAYCNRSMGKLLPHRDSLEGAEQRSSLQKAGFINATGHEAYGGCILYILRNLQGKYAGVYAYRMKTRKKQLVKFHTVVGDSGVGVFNHKLLLENKEVVLCNCPADAGALLSQGIDAAALLGTMDSKEEFLSVIKDANIRSAQIYSDHSPMGNYWAKQLAESLSLLGIEQKSYVPD